MTKKFEEIWKEATEEADYKYNPKGTISREVFLKIALKSRIQPIIQQQPLPVIPPFVAEWYEKHKNNLEYSIYSINIDINDLTKELTDIQYWFNTRKNKPMETIFEMKRLGYTVEKPKLFRLRLKNTILKDCCLWLCLATKQVYIDQVEKDWTNNGIVKNTFTEQEIVEISDGAFIDNKAFEKIEVEE